MYQQNHLPILKVIYQNFDLGRHVNVIYGLNKVIYQYTRKLRGVKANVRDITIAEICPELIVFKMSWLLFQLETNRTFFNSSLPIGTFIKIPCPNPT